MCHHSFETIHLHDRGHYVTYMSFQNSFSVDFKQCHYGPGILEGIVGSLRNRPTQYMFGQIAQAVQRTMQKPREVQFLHTLHCNVMLLNAGVEEADFKWSGLSITNTRWSGHSMIMNVFYA